MRSVLRFILLLLLAAPFAAAQTFKPVRASDVVVVSVLPTKCPPGRIFIKTAASAGLYVCVVRDTPVTSGSGGGATIAATTNVIKGDNAGNGIAAAAADIYGLFTGTKDGSHCTAGDGTMVTCAAGSSSVFDGSAATAPPFSATPTFNLANASNKSPVRIEPGTMTANVTSVTFTNKTAGAKFSIVWLQDGTGGRTVTHGASATNTCQTAMSTAANAWTEQFYEVASDGTTVYGVGCTGSDGNVRGLESAAPATPAATAFVCWADSTDHSGLECKANNSASIFKMVLTGVDINPVNGQLTVTGTTCTNQAITAISARAVGTCTTLTASYVDSSIAKTGAANTFTTGAQDFGAATSLKLPVGAGAAPSTNGQIAYDSTNNMLHAAQSSADAKIPQFTVTPANNDCAKWTVSGSNYKLDTAGSACGGSSKFSDSLGATSAITETGSDIAVFSTASVPALAAGKCYRIEIAYGLGGGASAASKLKVDSTVVSTLLASGDTSGALSWVVEYCNDASVQNAQHVSFEFGGYNTTNGANLGFTPYTGPIPFGPADNNIDWSTSHTISFTSNASSGTVTGHHWRIQQ